MKYRKLGHSEIDVSVICLGTMTWGEQNTQSEAFEQMDLALERGVNFWDVAEMYPVPVNQNTSGESERIIGNWFAKSGRRDDVVLATKVMGRSENKWIRQGEPPRVSKKQIKLALDQSLKRLRTDYVDLYQVHWPDRPLGLFGEGNGSYLHKGGDDIPIHESLEALSDLVKAGKIRTVGVSNETPWGIAQYLRAAENHDLARIVSIQNSYSLINRLFETGLSEFSYRENIGLLAYSPLGMGTLSGKYVGGNVPTGSRLDRFPDFMRRYQSEEAETAIARYAVLAREFDLSPTALALAYVNSRPFVTANIIGATTLQQLDENISSVEISISAELEMEIDQIHKQCKNPAAA